MHSSPCQTARAQEIPETWVGGGQTPPPLSWWVVGGRPSCPYPGGWGVKPPYFQVRVKFDFGAKGIFPCAVVGVGSISTYRRGGIDLPPGLPMAPCPCRTQMNSERRLPSNPMWCWWVWTPRSLVQTIFFEFGEWGVFAVSQGGVGPTSDKPNDISCFPHFLLVPVLMLS